MREKMCEYAKLAGHRAGNPSLTSKGMNGLFAPLFAEWERVLADDWLRYAKWGDGLPEDCGEVCRKFRLRI